MNTHVQNTLGRKDGLDMRHLVNWRRLLHAGGIVALAVCITSVTAAMGLVVASAQTREVPATGTSSSEPSTQASTPAPPLPMPPTRLVPQPEGTPLPPRDPTIADTWPPEFKQLIDNMITLFPKNTVDPAPNVEEVQRRIGITLTEEKLDFWDQRNWYKLYGVSGTRYVNPKDSIVFRSFYGIRKSITDDGNRSQQLQLQIGPKLSGFCLNPYDLAVYTGWKFVNADTSPHVNKRYWPPAYVWGMFAWSNTGRYGGPGYAILVSITEDATGKIVGADCVSSITVTGRYPKEE